jgi:hypothetical protein
MFSKIFPVSWCSLRRVTCLVFSLPFLAADPSGAQVRGRIVDEELRPISGVIVELWMPRERVNVRLSDDGGSFSFSAAEADGAVGLLARRIGLKPVHKALQAPGVEHLILMYPDVIELDALTVTAAAPMCPNREQGSAGAIWRRMASSYSRAPDTVGTSSYFAESRTTVPWSHLGTVDSASVRAGAWTGVSAGILAIARRDIRRTGYAYRIDSSTRGEFAAWQYPALHGYAAQHFRDEEFFERHRFSVLHDESGDLALVFCPRERLRSEPQMEGTLTLSSDTLLLRARWMFRTPRPTEVAGGEVVFAPPLRAAEPPLLLPATGLFWRREGPDRYHQLWRGYSRWVLSADRNAPQLHLLPKDSP